MKFILSMMLMDGYIPDDNGNFNIASVTTNSCKPVAELLCDSWDAARSLHDETHLHVREAVLFSLGTPLVCGSHVQVKAQ